MEKKGNYFKFGSLMSEIESDKTIKDFKKTTIYQDLMEIDNESIIGDWVKNKYYRTILYWAEPSYAVFIENKEDWKAQKEKSKARELKGIIYLVKISDNLFKFGRTTNMRKRLNQYPRGSEVIKFENVDDMYSSEKILLNCANESDGKQFHGNEYYYYTNPEEPIKVFDLALERIEKTIK